MIKILLLITLFFNILYANEKDLTQNQLKKKIGRMLLIGFDNTYIDKNSSIVKLIQKYNIGGVILFDRFYTDKNKIKNISSPKQLQELTSKLKKYSNKPLLISVDQEGGKVARLKKRDGFTKIPSANDVSNFSEQKTKQIYKTQAKMLSKNGFNCDFAPVVDLAVNPNNKVIFGLGRSYGKDVKKVVKYATIFIDELNKENIIGVLKHFPGHGSSLGDSHKGFVDISKTWNKQELEPYQILIATNKIKMIMTAHVFNTNLDDKYPATLSYKTNTKLLRQKMHYKGLIISDDLQMKAISKQYTLKQTVTLAINSGVDMLLFANQLDKQDIPKLINIIYMQIKNKKIKYSRIEESNKRIQNVFNH